VFGGGGQEGFEVLGGEDGVVIHDQKMGKVGKFFEGELAGGGESAPEAEVLAGRDEFAREGGFFGRFECGGVGAVVADDGGERVDGLAVEGFEEAGEEVGAEASGDQSHDLGCVRHHLKLAYRVACGELVEMFRFRFKESAKRKAELGKELVAGGG
jgi:hypothetical protein